MAKDSGEIRRFTGFRSPNYTQVPDELFDELMTDLSGSELKVLLYIIRRTFGFKRSSDSISLSQMMNGLQSRDGRVLDRGAGVSKPTLLQALRSLEERNIIVTERRRSAEKGDEPTIYRLQFATEVAASAASGPVVKKISHGVDKNFIPPVVKESTPQERELDKQNNNSNIRNTSSEFLNTSENESHTATGDQEHRLKRPTAPVSKKTGSNMETSAGMATIGSLVAQRQPSRPRLNTTIPGTAVTRISRKRQRTIHQDEDYQVILAYMTDFSRELNDQAPLPVTTKRAYNLYKRSGLNVEGFVQELYAARSVVKERTSTIQKRGDDTAAGPMRHKAAYYFAVLEDLLGLRESDAEPESGPPSSDRAR